MKLALTIAASDPSGGAGIQADLKAFCYAGVHGCSVLTCVTAQNTRRVSAIHEVPLEIIEAQIDDVLADVEISACKTGMLYSSDIVELAADKLEDHDFPLVVDPVMKATVGESLLKTGQVKALKRNLIPDAALVTPNIPEAKVLAERDVASIDDMKEAATSIYDLGPEHVLVKGGHLEGPNVTDVLFDGSEFTLYRSKRHPGDLHGTGCTFSALITALLARGTGMEDAVEEANMHMGFLIDQGYSIGKGVGVVGVTDQKGYTPEQLEVTKALADAVRDIDDMLPPAFVPEVGVNIGYAMEHATDLNHVCALEGRIVRLGGGPTGEKTAHLGRLRFGVSRHVARIILTAMKHDASKRSAMNIRCKKEILDSCQSADLRIGSFDRKDEPEDISTMEWGTEKVIMEMGSVPDIIFDTGGIGKEPMIRIIGNDPSDVLSKLRSIVGESGKKIIERL